MADVVVSLECALASDDQCRLLYPSTSTPVRYNENSHARRGQRECSARWFQRSIAFLAKGMGSQIEEESYDSNSEQSSLDSFSNSGRMQWDNALRQYQPFLNHGNSRSHAIDFHEDLKIGEGGFSKVYRGWIDNRTLEVAIKLLKESGPGQSLMFRSEIQLNPSFVLHNHLYPMDSEHHDPLPWEKRLEICIGAARGLQYLHSETTHTIIHRDIRPTKILLDENWIAKVTDFELAKVLHSEDTGITTLVCGTFGYLDPEYYLRARLTKKSDVYAFGMVLLEVLCARKPFDYSLDEDQKPLQPDCLREFVKIAWKCVLERGAERPSMDEVVGNLQIALQLQQNWHYDNEFDNESHNESEEQDWFPSLGIMDLAWCSRGLSTKEPPLFAVKRLKSMSKLGAQEFWTENKMLSNLQHTHLVTLIGYCNESQERLEFALASLDLSAYSSTDTEAADEEAAVNVTAIAKPSPVKPDSPSSSHLPPVLPCRRFSLTEVQADTNNFHRNLVIKYGSPGGEIYIGYIDNRKLQVAIERCTLQRDMFLAEVEMRTRFHHLHMVSFIGHCKDS
ncbi:malectin/receptor-like protein kinase family protein [Actinidia rufa]|uniref:non-specific serine/threonine protein kinase n=1 Tax=Actinidia rufa TaxID=165716 RepID=A0A7J0EKM7_9ERIC|nr:malectin/receptor-like protein kinase family protein [Actinidia rufa]